MKNWYRKIWFLVLIFFFFLFLFGILKKEFDKEEVFGLKSNHIEEVLVEEELEVLKVEVEKEIETSKEGVFVPYYWKSSINVNEDDYLKGNIPNIKEFKEYFSTRNLLLYGKAISQKNYSFSEVNEQLKDSKIIYSNGIRNESEVFDWNSDSCIKLFSNEIDGNIFLCKYWINWLGLDIKDRSYVLTNCSIEGVEGYCVFEDYTNVYYKYKNLGEGRCFDPVDEEYLCNYEKYVRLIEFN